ncbi:efflux RND transporter periplasmic adaptor subunit [Subsaximicrobium wynnwilliamsii]|uniref:Efflux RND transporter periplasmic adaptor subunit n=1 Tax=Subsaximicrobium wynnwilliamsii TaxID=291179 RepID=A0A5C6ZK30_9FLAO|nr:efflux RND transporter periplasmic adaptor subunit [Subsaximicrobium wynnwilliamsii]TXD84471.1 efflux RND transporter periplasmic adaptor subunit [Subsaximicrobium wynnwilliamsii]TXD90152.1 efflux RND transporter periplasmic adaptor subunit [Subsaximicrobium wynnwilliamsii]TXE04204.1 efflux RND transporter periplasmic adaptor subunit [Subsaximicrobium wynnwilliamsii]
MKYLIIAVFAFLAMSCNEKAEDAHAHNEDGSHAGEEIPRLSHTIWTDKTESFVEFPALIVGSPSRFAAHFTVLDKHQPVREGSVTLSLIKGDKGLRNTAEKPSSPGIFSPTIQPKEAGTYQLVFELKTPDYSDKITINDVTVYANTDDAIKALGTAEEDAGISFLKEQAWKIDFQTAVVVSGEIYDVINTSGVWMPSPGSVKSLAAKSNGVVDFKVNNLTEGTAVKQGQLLMSLNSQGLASNNLSTEIANARSNFNQAKSEYERKKELYDSKIIPKSEFEKVESNFSIAKSNYQSLTSGVSGGSKQIRAPFEGFIKSITVSNGDYVEQGVALVTVGTHQSKVLKTQLAPNYGLSMENVQGIWYQTKNGEWKSVTDAEGEILSIGKDVERENPLISVYAKVNVDVDMPEGSLTPVQIAMGNATQNTMIPVNAILEDYGSYSVIVQLSGESFERRPVQIGKRNGENVEILQGLEVGEVVVTTGAYQVKMASMSGSTPAHGHDH